MHRSYSWSSKTHIYIAKVVYLNIGFFRFSTFTRLIPLMHFNYRFISLLKFKCAAMCVFASCFSASIYMCITPLTTFGLSMIPWFHSSCCHLLDKCLNQISTTITNKYRITNLIQQIKINTILFCVADARYDNGHNSFTTLFIHRKYKHYALGIYHHPSQNFLQHYVVGANLNVYKSGLDAIGFKILNECFYLIMNTCFAIQLTIVHNSFVSKNCITFCISQSNSTRVGYLISLVRKFIKMFIVFWTNIFIVTN